ncbi:MAG: hypothetical protein K2N96_10110, partial [Muribaculaceae bacterium]|nr:hypothetical protein [Muribaculaceae bacterium]
MKFALLPVIFLVYSLLWLVVAGCSRVRYDSRLRLQLPTLKYVMRFSPLIYLLQCLLVTAACSNDTARRNLDRVDSMLEADPAAASLLLDSISPRSTADSARHSLYRLVTIGKLTGIIDNDSLLSTVRGFYTGNDPDHPTRDAMIADYYLGTEAMEKNRIPSATSLLTAAKEAGETLRDTAYLCRIYGHLAYLSQKDYNGQ